MTTLLRTVRTAVFAVATAVLLASCHDEGGVLDVYFGSRGSGDCDSVSVTIDLDAADAVLAPGFTDDEDCSLPQFLEDAGCDLSVELLNGGARARVTVSGCDELDATSPLFRCGFSDGALEDLSFVSKATCDCSVANCDPTPPLCVNDNPNLDGCERCTNGSDDDNNGSIDCEDPACENSPACNDSTTTTSSSSTSVTSGVSSTTSTTLRSEPVQKFAVTFSIADGQNIGALQFDIGYDSVGLRSRSIVSDPVCRKLVDTSLASFDYDTEAQVVHVSMTNLPGTSGPLDLVECTFAASSIPTAGDFSLDVTAALDLQGQPIVSPPPLELGSVVPVTTTTTEEPVTTTVQVTTTTEDGVTTTTLPGERDAYEVTFRLASADAAVGAIQFRTSYASAAGDFEGSGSSVECTNLVPGVLFAPNDKDRVCSLDQEKVCAQDVDCSGGKGTCSIVKKELVLGLISLDGFSAPIAMVRCRFLGSVDAPPVAADFPITIDDSTNVDGELIGAAVSVTITPPSP